MIISESFLRKIIREEIENSKSLKDKIFNQATKEIEKLNFNGIVNALKILLKYKKYNDDDPLYKGANLFRSLFKSRGRNTFFFGNWKIEMKYWGMRQSFTNFGKLFLENEKENITKNLKLDKKQFEAIFKLIESLS